MTLQRQKEGDPSQLRSSPEKIRHYVQCLRPSLLGIYYWLHYIHGLRHK